MAPPALFLAALLCLWTPALAVNVAPSLSVGGTTFYCLGQPFSVRCTGDTSCGVGPPRHRTLGGTLCLWTPRVYGFAQRQCHAAGRCRVASPKIAR